MKDLIAAGLIALCLSPALLHAQGLPLNSTTGSDLGIELSDQNFEADRDGVFAMAVAGRKVGVVGSFTQALDTGWHWGGDARIATGATALDSATLGKRSGDAQTVKEVRLTLGRDLESASFVLSPYVGLGYRDVFSYLKGYTDTGHASASRSDTQVYVPLGLTHRVHAGYDARLSTTLEYDYLLEGRHQTFYTDIIGYTSDLHNTQKTGHGARLDLAYETQHWSAGVFYHYWNIQESEIGTYTQGVLVFSATEPHNITRELGVQLKYRFN